MNKKDFLVLLVFAFACSMKTVKEEIFQTDKTYIDSSANIPEKRFACPDSFTRVVADTNSFAAYLRNLKLKQHGSPVLYYDGSPKNRPDVYAAVVDMEIGTRDLQQCADAVMRLRAEYLFSQKQYNQISFRFVSDRKMHDYLSFAGADRSGKVFLAYMDHVFTYANTASLIKQLKKKPMDLIEPGDVLIQSGNPYGHAVIVVDVCQAADGRRKYMLAQSYMPAQEIQILYNTLKDGVWYDQYNEGEIETPEWRFTCKDLYTW